MSFPAVYDIRYKIQIVNKSENDVATHLIKDMAEKCRRPAIASVDVLLKPCKYFSALPFIFIHPSNENFSRL